MVELKHQRQPNRNLRSGHRQDKQEHDLSIRLRPSGTGHDEGESRRVQHYFNRHQDEDQVAASEKSGQPQREQDRRQ